MVARPSRRDLGRMVAAAGLVWATPVVTSMGLEVAAGTVLLGCCQCLDSNSSAVQCDPSKKYTFDSAGFRECGAFCTAAGHPDSEVREGTCRNGINCTLP